MTIKQEQDLRGVLEGRLTFDEDSPRSVSCDNTHNLTRQFLADQGLEVEVELAALQERGGRCCDCEVLMNCRLGE